MRTSWTEEKRSRRAEKSKRMNLKRPVFLGPLIVSRLLVVHAISGCDTTSCLFGHGKVSVHKKIKWDTTSYRQVGVFYSDT
jgi:hypothetical protein